MILEKGRLCMKIAGREASKYCVIAEAADGKNVMITGPKTITGVRRKKCNIMHLEPTANKLDIGSGSDVDIENSWKKSGLIDSLGIKIPKFKERK